MLLIAMATAVTGRTELFRNFITRMETQGSMREFWKYVEGGWRGVRGVFTSYTMYYLFSFGKMIIHIETERNASYSENHS